MDRRLAALEDWITGVLDVADFEVRPLSVDASFRRYYRVFTGGTTSIAMDAPPDREDTRSYVEIAQRFLALGLNVPEILHQDVEAGFLLISDLGDRLYLRELREENVDRLYGDAMGALIVLQAGIFTDSSFLPEYDDALLTREMELFREWYLGRHLQLRLSERQQGVVDRIFARLMQNALEQPKVWVHRDYHSRNLMLTKRNNPGILDFQDAVRGPVTYDLVSLLRDCYISWPREQVESWVKGYHQLALESGVPVCDSEAQFLEWFDRMGMQRHLKAVGIFSRLQYRDGKPTYLDDIPRTMGYVFEVCGRYRDLRPFRDLLSELGVAESP